MALHLLQPEATRHWRRTDPVMARLSQAHPLPPTPQLGAGADGFSVIVESITMQQVSMAAGRAIHGRLVGVLGGAVTPRRVLDRSPERLREAGLSRTKAATLHDLAQRTLDGQVEFHRFPELPDPAIVEELVLVKGIGPWTAKMFLIFHLGRPDVFAPEDLGLRMAVAEAYGVPPTGAARLMEDRRPAWSPYNSVAARVLWNSRRSPPGAAPACAPPTVPPAPLRAAAKTRPRPKRAPKRAAAKP